MALNIVVSPLVRFKVEGKFTAEDGADAPFDFHLTLDRLADDMAIKALQDDIKDLGAKGSETPLTDAILKRAHAWQGPKGPEGQDVPFSAEALRGVLNMSGMAMLVYMTYLRETGAKAKNS